MVSYRKRAAIFMSNEEINFWFTRWLYGLLGVTCLYLIIKVMKWWGRVRVKARLHDIEVQNKKTQDIVKSLSNDQLIDDANKFFRK